MAQVQGVVISVSLSTQVEKQNGGKYEAWELVYKTDRGEIRSLQKPVQGLKFNPKLRDGLNSLQPGDQFTAVVEKNAQGFLDVKSVEKGHVVADHEPQAPATRPTSPSNNFQGRDFESKEERTKKQEYIIRQSSLTNALSLLSVGAKAAPKVEEVLDVAEKLVAFVYNQKEVPEVTDLDEDIPY